MITQESHQSLEILIAFTPEILLLLQQIYACEIQPIIRCPDPATKPRETTQKGDASQTILETITGVISNGGSVPTAELYSINQFRRLEICLAHSLPFIVLQTN